MYIYIYSDHRPRQIGTTTPPPRGSSRASLEPPGPRPASGIRLLPRHGEQGASLGATPRFLGPRPASRIHLLPATGTRKASLGATPGFLGPRPASRHREQKGISTLALNSHIHTVAFNRECITLGHKPEALDCDRESCV